MVPTMVSSRPNWDPLPHPSPEGDRVPPPLWIWGGGAHSLAGEGVGCPNLDVLCGHSQLTFLFPCPAIRCTCLVEFSVPAHLSSIIYLWSRVLIFEKKTFFSTSPGRQNGMTFRFCSTIAKIFCLTRRSMQCTHYSLS
jgi:hypothetical protein